MYSEKEHSAHATSTVCLCRISSRAVASCTVLEPACETLQTLIFVFTS